MKRHTFAPQVITCYRRRRPTGAIVTLLVVVMAVGATALMVFA